jgi:ATP-dependent NAD(P)H-hydrate dehydratase
MYLRKHEYPDTEKEAITQKVVDSVSAWFPSLHVLIVGPGLGRDSFVQNCTKRILAKAKEARLPLVIDGVLFCHTCNLI